MIFVRAFRYVNHAKFRYKFINPGNTFRTPRKNCVHTSVNLSIKMYMEKENKYAYNIIENKGYAKELKVEENHDILNEDEFKNVLKKNWSEATPSQLFEIFGTLGNYCTAHKLCVSDKIFDQFIDNLTDNIHNATDNELESLFHALLRWPETESIRTRNYIEVWAALDNACLDRINRWNYDEMLHFISLFFMLNVTKASDYCVKSINKLATKAKHLTKSQLVRTMFFIGVLRKQPFDMFNLEVRAIELIENLSLDDLAIMSMGFFKSRTPIRHFNFVSQIIDKIIKKPKEVHEVSLAALLKVIRYSVKISSDDTIYRLLDTLQHEVPRLSIMCNVHLALLGTSTLTLHKECLTQIANKVIENLESARIKDLERLVLTYGTFNFKPHTKECLFGKIIEELSKEERLAEINKHGRSFACCINYMTLLQFHPVHLIKYVLSPQFLKKAYGGPYNYGKEILSIHNTTVIFCPEIDMYRLSDKIAKIIAKRHTDYFPNENYKKQYNVTEKMILEIVGILKEDRGGEDYVIGDHILTHHQRGDIIICDDHNRNPVAVKNVWCSDFGLLKKPPDANKWMVLVVAGRNAIIRDTNMPTGFFTNKVKELTALGFHAILVPWSSYESKRTRQEKSNYLKELINNKYTST